MVTDQEKLQKMIELGMELSHIQDIDLLLEKILSAIRTLLHADAGTIYVKEGNSLTFSHSQNDTLQKHIPPGKKLLYKTLSIPVTPQSIAGYVARTGDYLNIPDVYGIHRDKVPYTFDRSFDQKTQYRTRSMLTLPLKNSQSRMIGVIQIINAQNAQDEVVPFSEQDIPMIKVFASHAVLAIERAQLAKAEMLGLIRFLTELRDPEETAAHVKRVGAYTAEIYEQWALRQGISWAKIETNIDIVRMAAMLHDVGKLAIPHKIREKPGRFTNSEYDIMKQHTIKGAQMLHKSAQSRYEEIAVEIALNHHEYWDGSGYPGHIDLETGLPRPDAQDSNKRTHGKRGTEIPVYGRAAAIADTFDALLCRRAFREAMQEKDVLKMIKHGSGKQFDPDMVDAFFSCIDTLREIAERFPNKEG